MAKLRTIRKEFLRVSANRWNPYGMTLLGLFRRALGALGFGKRRPAPIAPPPGTRAG